jgi:hypothetical protein
VRPSLEGRDAGVIGEESDASLYPSSMDERSRQYIPLRDRRESAFSAQNKGFQPLRTAVTVEDGEENVVACRWQIVDALSRSGLADVARFMSVKPANRQPRRCRRVTIGHNYATV